MKEVMGGIALVLVAAFWSGATAGETVPARAFGGVSCAVAPQSGGGVVSMTPVQGVGRAAPNGGLRPVAQVSRNDKADVTFELRPAAGGGAEVAAGSGPLQVKKTVQHTGDFTLELKTDRDTVTISVNGRGTRVRRGRSTIDLTRQNQSLSRESETRRLLADSDAVLKYRGMADALMAADDRSPSALSVIIGDAVVGVLAGDVGATRRTAQFLAHSGARNRRPVGMALDCFALMEQRMVEAFDDYSACWISVSSNPLNSFYQQLCGYRWIVQVESYWFSFLSCSGFNW